MTEREAPARRDSFFGRRKGKGLRSGQAEALATTLADLRIDVGVPPPSDLRSLFPVPVEAVALEIGFGGGEHLIHRALTEPSVGRIGVEPFVNGMAKASRAIAAEGIRNVRLFDRDAAELLDWLPERSLVLADLLYPDPWPKRRHWKRRFVNARNLDRLARVLVPGGLFRFASDIDSYVAWTLAHADAHPAFRWTARSADDWREPFPGWPGTRYEKKALREGRRGTYLTFERV